MFISAFRSVYLPQKSKRIDTQGISYVSELNYVETSLTAFEFGHERLWLDKPLRELSLAKASPLPSFDQEQTKAPIILGAKRLGHETTSLNPE